MGVLFAVTAQASDALADLPLAEVIQPLIKQFTILFGGIAGLYLLLVLARVYYERKKVRLLKDIRFDLDQWNIHHKVSDSRERKGWIRRKLSSKQHHKHEKKSHKK
tara:strand:+ start:4523 stop:4840 length:318 start_codon:yes stop_codon:yes gene_type:complete